MHINIRPLLVNIVLHFCNYKSVHSFHHMLKMGMDDYKNCYSSQLYNHICPSMDDTCLCYFSHIHILRCIPRHKHCPGKCVHHKMFHSILVNNGTNHQLDYMHRIYIDILTYNSFHTNDPGNYQDI